MAAILDKSRLFLDKSRLWNDTVWYVFFGYLWFFVSILDYSIEIYWNLWKLLVSQTNHWNFLVSHEISWDTLWISTKPSPQQSGRAYRSFQHVWGPIFPFAMRLQRHQDACGQVGKAWWKIEPTLIDGKVQNIWFQKMVIYIFVDTFTDLVMNCSAAMWSHTACIVAKGWKHTTAKQNPVWLNKFYQFQPLPTRVAKPRKETPYMYSLYSYHGFAIFHDERYVKTGSRSACFIQNPNPLVTLPPLRVPLLWRADFRNLEAALRTMLGVGCCVFRKGTIQCPYNELEPLVIDNHELSWTFWMQQWDYIGKC